MCSFVVKATLVSATDNRGVALDFVTSLQHGAFEDEQSLVLILEFAMRVRGVP